CYSASCSNVITRPQWMLLGYILPWKYAMRRRCFYLHTKS
ncbi:hypothetical protein, partial (plasmid) [Salmonella enterica subsp. enterica serovar Enteritidis]